MFIYYLFVWLICSLRFAYLKSIRTDYVLLTGNYYTFLRFGSHTTDSIMRVDTIANYSWVIPGSYKLSISDSKLILALSDTITFYNNTAQNATLLRDNVQIWGTHTQLGHFIFYYIKSVLYNKDTLSLCFKYTNTSFSFVHTLKANDYIDKLSFALSSANDGKRTMIFGSVDTSDIMAYPYVFPIHIDTNYTDWGFYIESYTLNDVVVDVNAHIAVQIASEKIVFPSTTFDAVIVNGLFHEQLRKGTCVVKTSSEFKRIECMPEVIKSINMEMKFKVKGCLFVIKDDELWSGYTNMNNTFVIATNVFYPGKWMLGGAFFSKYLIEFDYEKESIILYSKVKFNANVFDNVVLTVIKWVDVVMLLGIFVICVNKYIKCNYNL